ncbi:MAG: UDP-N-acetylglucosamine 1-carboxyvinyltransferase [Planctomycetota bacterium]|nr:UDP-N-acetylglucosamine 1-carboxyvinyltransferase [Planctomycetota bacterium]
MDAFSIHGGQRLTGKISVDGSKNAALPLLAASLLTQEPVKFECVPDLSDIANMYRLLEELGCTVQQGKNAVSIKTDDENQSHARYDIVRTMRASVCVLGPMLARRGVARVSMPGGCSFGDRPIDLHLRGLEALGARIELDSGDIIAHADRLRGATIFLGGPFGSTVLGTANVMSAATLASGRTIIESAACEPEIADLAILLNAMGAKISGAGTPRITIDGVDELGGAKHTVMPDRIVAGTWAIACAITNGEVEIDRFPLDHLLAVTNILSKVGVHINQTNTSEDPACCSVRVVSDRNQKPVMFTTQPFPGFPTDLQAQMMALLCLSRGNSIITEKIYPERFMHVPELSRMGARLVRQGSTVVVQGVDHLVGAPVMASDLRASASLIIAGLAAEGETVVSRVYHLDRGYAAMEKTLSLLGAEIKRIDGDQVIDGLPVVETIATKKFVKSDR